MDVYHVWFATRRRRWLLLGDIEESVKESLWATARDKSIELLECETMVDHVHLLLRSEPSKLPRVVHDLKGASSRRALQRFPELRLDGAVPSLWQRRYAAEAIPSDAVGRVATYIRTQKERPEAFDQPSRAGGVLP